MQPVKIGELLSLFDSNSMNEFERMALFYNSTMQNGIKKMEDAIAEFKKTGDYPEYLLIKSAFEEITKYMIGRDAFTTHNPDRNVRNY